MKLKKSKIDFYLNRINCRDFKRKENCPDSRRSQKDDSHTVFRRTRCADLEQSIDHSQQRGK